MLSVFLMVWLWGCAHPPGVTLPAESQLTPVAQTPNAKAARVHGLVDLSCTEDGCSVLSTAGRRSLDPVSLVLGVATPEAFSPFPAVVLNEEPGATDARWNVQIAGGWRSPFQEQVPTPTGGRLTYMRSMAPGMARLVRFGGGMHAQPAPRASSPFAYRRWLALHPTGKQAYLVPWPHTEVLAVDPDRLLTGWRLDLGSPTLGLFVERTGRYLIGETGAEPSDDRLLDYSGKPIAVDDGVDPSADPHIAEIPRPMGTHTIVIDLEAQTLVARLPGTYRRWVQVDGGALIATSEAVARLPL
jgi:hypothetical protein